MQEEVGLPGIKSELLPMTKQSFMQAISLKQQFQCKVSSYVKDTLI